MMRQMLTVSECGVPRRRKRKHNKKTHEKQQKGMAQLGLGLGLHWCLGVSFVTIVVFRCLDL